jgi:hypothetical protein
MQADSDNAVQDLPLSANWRWWFHLAQGKFLAHIEQAHITNFMLCNWPNRTQTFVVIESLPPKSSNPVVSRLRNRQRDLMLGISRGAWI